MIGTIAVSLGLGAVVRRWIDPALAVVVTLLVVTMPIATVASAFLWWAVARFRAAARTRIDEEQEREAALEAAELVGLALAGGLSVAAAHRVALEHAPPPVVASLASLIGTMERFGVTEGLGGDTGPMTASSEVLVAASASGAPVLPALRAFVSREHHRRHMQALERARRLPIRLLIPLTLLVLPGFVLILIGPTVVDSLARLVP